MHPNETDTRYGATPLHYAALFGRTESMKIIMDCVTADQKIQLMPVQ